jgi:hypothetical protein
MLNLLLWFLLLIALSLGAYLQLQYAYAGYPKDWRWKAVLFAMGIFTTGLTVYVVVYRLSQDSIPPIILLGALIFGGVMSTWVLPVRMRYVIPRKRKHDT